MTSTATPNLSPAPRDASIAIVGAGPGGLTAARILQLRGLQVTVYDHDVGFDARDQGGSLDLRVEDGQRALVEAGLIDRFFALARHEGQEMRQVDPATGEIILQLVPDDDEQEKPEIDRAQLRRLLLESVAPGTVRWGAPITAVDAAAEPAGGRVVHFADGSSAYHDLVIGADGAFSRTRRAVSAAVPRYTGILFFEAWFNQVSDRHPWLDSFVGGGAAAGGDGDRGMFAQRNSGGHIRVYLMLKTELDWLATHGLAATDTDGIRTALLAEFRDWDPQLKRMITDNDGPFIPRPIWTLPVDHRWEHSPSLTLIGDAAHLMPPVGVGVNLAMLDACDLAVALSEQPTIDDAVRAYESLMWPRSAQTAAQVEQMATNLLHGAPPPMDDER